MREHSPDNYKDGIASGGDLAQVMRDDESGGIVALNGTYSGLADKDGDRSKSRSGSRSPEDFKKGKGNKLNKEDEKRSKELI